MENYKFIKDYTYKTGSSCPEGMIGCAPEIISFKKGDILGGISNNLSKDGKNIVSYRGNFSYTIPIEYLVKIEENQPINTQQPLIKNMDVLTPEDKLYEKLGIKYNNTHMFGVASRIKGRLLVALVLVAGYFAYKKLKK
jgi:hypothetical protein